MKLLKIIMLASALGCTGSSIAMRNEVNTKKMTRDISVDFATHTEELNYILENYNLAIRDHNYRNTKKDFNDCGTSIQRCLIQQCTLLQENFKILMEASTKRPKTGRHDRTTQNLDLFIQKIQKTKKMLHNEKTNKAFNNIQKQIRQYCIKQGAYAGTIPLNGTVKDTFIQNLFVQQGTLYAYHTHIRIARQLFSQYDLALAVPQPKQTRPHIGVDALGKEYRERVRYQSTFASKQLAQDPVPKKPSIPPLNSTAIATATTIKQPSPRAIRTTVPSLNVQSLQQIATDKE